MISDQGTFEERLRKITQPEETLPTSTSKDTRLATPQVLMISKIQNRTKTKIIITTTGEPHNQEQDQLQEQRRLLHHHRNRPVGVRKAKKAQTIKNPKS